MQISNEAKALLAAGETCGVFQVESEGMKALCRRLQPETLDELAALIALYRPGPMKLCDDFIARKWGEAWEAPLPSLQTLLQPTYAILVYQEQIMELVQIVAGLTLAQADILRRAIGKKKRELLDEQKELFAAGCREQGNGAVSEHLWALIEEFADYGFNKCVSGDTEVCRGYKNNHGNPNVGHLYKCYHDHEYAKKHGAKSLRDKIRRNGYGVCQAVCEDGRIRPMPIKDIHYNGKRKLYEVVLENGKTIKITYNHRLLTDGGYKQANCLVEGDMVAVVGERSQGITYRRRCAVTQEEHRAIIRSGGYSGAGFPSGEENPAYIDGRISDFNSVKRDLAWITWCERCKCDGSPLEHHHVNGNVTENSFDNIEKLCSSCHKKAEYALGRNKVWHNGRCVEYSRVRSITPLDGEHETYDVEMDTEEHNWVANGIVSHNSHAMAYAVLTVETAELKAHHPVEFMTALLNAELGNASRIQELVNECRRMGITVLPPDINLSKAEFSVVS